MQRTSAPRERGVVEALLPARYHGLLAVEIAVPNGTCFPPGAHVTIRMLWLLRPGHPQTVRLPVGRFTYTGLPAP